MCNGMTRNVDRENMTGDDRGRRGGEKEGWGAWRKGRRGEQRRKGGRGPTQNKVASTKM